MKLHGSDNRGGINVKTYTKSTCSQVDQTCPDMSYWTFKNRSILLVTKSYSQNFLFKWFELSAFFSVHTSKTEYSVSLSVASTLLRELLNTVYHKDQSWDLYSSASNDLPLLILSNYAEWHITGKGVLQLPKTLNLCVNRISIWCNTTNMLINPVNKSNGNYNTTKASVLRRRGRSLDGHNIENVTDHCLLSLTVDNSFR